MRRHLLSDEAVEATLAERETLQYSLKIDASYPGSYYTAEIEGPFDHELYGRRASGIGPRIALGRLENQLRKLGFIGRLERVGDTIL